MTEHDGFPCVFSARLEDFELHAVDRNKGGLGNVGWIEHVHFLFVFSGVWLDGTRPYDSLRTDDVRNRRRGSISGPGFATGGYGPAMSLEWEQIIVASHDPVALGRLHIDLRPDDQDAEVERLIGLGRVLR